MRSRFFLKRWEKCRGRLHVIFTKEIEKLEDCENMKKGFKLLVCEGCHDIRKIPFPL